MIIAPGTDSPFVRTSLRNGCMKPLDAEALGTDWCGGCMKCMDVLQTPTWKVLIVIFNVQPDAGIHFHTLKL